MGFYEPCAARRNKADGSMALALWALLGATTSQMAWGAQQLEKL